MAKKTLTAREIETKRRAEEKARKEAEKAEKERQLAKEKKKAEKVEAKKKAKKERRVADAEESVAKEKKAVEDTAYDLELLGHKFQRQQQELENKKRYQEGNLFLEEKKLEEARAS